jgi:hypothetical protein
MGSYKWNLKESHHGKSAYLNYGKINSSARDKLWAPFVPIQMKQNQVSHTRPVSKTAQLNI